MKHRGRHRRRRRGQALRATLAGTALALTAAATLISTSQATGSNSPGALTPLTSVAETSRLQLHENLVAGDTLSTLSRNMGGNVGVSGVLASADHTMRGEADCSGTERAALPSNRSPPARTAGPRTTRGAGSGRPPPSPPPVTPNRTAGGATGGSSWRAGTTTTGPRAPPPRTGVWPGSPSSTRATRRRSGTAGCCWSRRATAARTSARSAPGWAAWSGTRAS